MTQEAKNRLGIVRSTLAVALALLLPVGVYLLLGTRIDNNAKTAFVEQCQGNNQTRADFLAFVDSTVVRSKRALNATLHAPSASPHQKVAAIANLAGLEIVQRDAHAKEKPKSCMYPPQK